MDFEIEDDDDPYDFQSNWSKPSKEKSGFGFGYDAGGGGGGDDDAYNYDFGVIKEETSHYSGNQLSSKSSNKKTSPAKTKPKAVTGGNAMEKAAAMLDRYSGNYHLIYVTTVEVVIPSLELRQTIVHENFKHLQELNFGL